MKGSIIIVLFFICGVFLGRYFDTLSFVLDTPITMYVLYCLIFAVGLSIGSDKNSINALKNQNIRVLLLPICTVCGTLLGALLVSPLISGFAVKDVLAISAGMGYYSLSSILLTEYRGVEVGTMALVANVIRETTTLLAAPFMVRFFGKLSVVSAAGVTSYDVLLPVITRFSGKEVVVISILHGLVLELTVPLLITFLAGL